MPDFTIPSELIEHLNRGDCVLFVGDALTLTVDAESLVLRGSNLKTGKR